MILTNHFAARMAYELGRENTPEIAASAAKVLENYYWPGNIRELKNIIERAVYKSHDHIINKISFDPFISPFSDEIETDNKDKATKINIPAEYQYETKEFSDNIFTLPDKIASKPFKEAIFEVEKLLLTDALKQCRFNQKAAAKKLGLTYHQLRGLLKKHELRKVPTFGYPGSQMSSSTKSSSFSDKSDFRCRVP